MDLVMYESRRGKQQSGAYLFLPDGKAHSILTPNKQPRVAVTTGPLVSGKRAKLVVPGFKCYCPGT